MPTRHYKISLEARSLVWQRYNIHKGLQSNLIRKLGDITPRGSATSKTPTTVTITTSADVSEGDLDKFGSEFRAKTAAASLKSLRCGTVKKKRLKEKHKAEFLPEIRNSTANQTKFFEGRLKCLVSRDKEVSVKSPRSSRRGSKVAGKNDYNQKIIDLPMCRINVETHVGPQRDQITVNKTRQEINEIFEDGRRRPVVSTQHIPPLVDLSGQISGVITERPCGDNGDADTVESKRPNIPRHGVNIIHFDKSDRVVRYNSSERLATVGRGNRSAHKASQTRTADNHMTEHETSSSAKQKAPPVLAQRTIIPMKDFLNEFSNHVVIRKPINMREDTQAVSFGYAPVQDQAESEPRSSKSRRPAPPQWPSRDDINRLKTPLHHISFLNVSGQDMAVAKSHPGATRAKEEPEDNPKLRYTSHPPKVVLEPIIVPSHTNTDCPVCNAYFKISGQQDCPPNSRASTPDCEQGGHECKHDAENDTVRADEMNSAAIIRIPGAEPLAPMRESTSRQGLLSRRESLPNHTFGSSDSASQTSTVEIPLISIHKSYSRSYSSEKTSSAGSGTYRLNYTKVQSPTDFTNR